VIYITHMNNLAFALEVTFNGYEFMAVDPATYEGGCPVGIGATAEAAIADWKGHFQ
jgi:hypothetical protein